MFNYAQVPKTKEYRDNFDNIFGKPEDAKKPGKGEKEMIRNKIGHAILAVVVASVFVTVTAIAIAFADSAVVHNQNNRPAHTEVLPLFTNQSTTGVAGTVYDLGFLASEHTWMVDFTGSPSSVLVILQGTVDGANWFNLREFTGTADAMEHIVNRPIRKIRGYLTTLDTGSVTIRSIHGGN
jgi:hypothetical protein